MLRLTSLLSFTILAFLSSSSPSSASASSSVSYPSPSISISSTGNAFTHSLHPGYTIHGAPIQPHKQSSTSLTSTSSESSSSSSSPLRSDPNAAWNYDTSLRMDLYSIIAYQNASVVMNWLCDDCQRPETIGFIPTSIITDVATDTHAYVGFSPFWKEIVIAFRGTHTLQDWIDDLQFWKTDVPFCGLPGAFTATGFFNCHEKLKDQSVAAIRQAINQVKEMDSESEYSLYVTGHSLGGALATLSALELSYRYKFPLQVYTFGAPRSGDQTFSTYYDEFAGPTWRMTHDADPVPRLPFESMGFSHVKREIWQEDAIAKYHACSGSSDDDPSCADSVAWFTNIYDHLHYMNLTCCSETVPIDPSRLPVVLHDPNNSTVSLYVGTGEKDSKIIPISKPAVIQI